MPARVGTPRFLSADQQRFFHENGYLIVHDLFTAAEVDAMRRSMDTLLRDPQSCDHRVHFTSDGVPAPSDPTNPRRIWRIMDLPWAGDIWFQLLAEPRIVDAMVDLLGPNINFHNGKAILKPAYHKNTQGWHQDFPYERHTEPDLAAAIIYLHDVALGQGATAIAPGTHTSGEWPHSSSEEGLLYIPDERVDGEVVHVEGKAGTVAFIHVLVVHRAGDNNTDHTKCAVINEYKTAETRDLWDNRLAYAELPLRRDGKRTGWL